MIDKWPSDRLITDVSQVSQDLVECGHGVDGVVFEHVRVDPLGDYWVVPHHSGDSNDWDPCGQEQADR